jgi:hypothetical protein
MLESHPGTPNRRGVWIKNLSNGVETLLTDTTTPKGYVALSRDASQVAFGVGPQPELHDIYHMRVKGGPARKLCGACGDPVYWFGDGRRLLIIHGRNTALASLEIESGRIREIARAPELNIQVGRLSADDRWAAFTACCPRRIYITPVRDGVSVAPDEWIGVNGPGINSRPYWSPSGTLLYFTSTRDGSSCIWAQRLDPMTKRPTGEAFAVYHSHAPGATSTRSIVQFAVASKRLIYSLREAAGNLWSTDAVE